MSSVEKRALIEVTVNYAIIGVLIPLTFYFASSNIFLRWLSTPYDFYFKLDTLLPEVVANSLGVPVLEKIFLDIADVGIVVHLMVMIINYVIIIATLFCAKKLVSNIYRTNQSLIHSLFVAPVIFLAWWLIAVVIGFVVLCATAFING